MKKRITAGIAAGMSTLLCCAFCVGVTAEETTAYQPGDTVNNFVITSFSDEAVSLDELLETKDVVLISMWSSWSESSAQQIDGLVQLSEELGDQVGILEITSKAWDTIGDAEDIWMSMVEPSMSEEAADSMIAGEISEELAEKFACESYPTTYLIDKNHTLCFVHEGVIRDIDAFRQQLEQVYTADSYEEPVILEELPESEHIREEEDETQLSEVLTDGQMTVTNPNHDPMFGTVDIISPFLLNDDSSAVYPSNQGTDNPLAVLEIDFSADAGSMLAVDYRMDHTSPDSGALLLHVDDRLENTIRKDTDDWETAFVTIKSSGDHELYLRYFNIGENTESHLEVGNIRLLTDEEASQVYDPLKDAPKNLEEQEGRIELLGAEDARKLQNTEFEDDILEKWITEGAETVRLRFQIGEAFKLNNALITIGQTTLQDTSDFETEVLGQEMNAVLNSIEIPAAQVLFLKDLEWDEDGFYLDLPLCEGVNTITLAGSMIAEENTAILKIYTSTEAPLQEMMQVTTAFSDVPGFLETMLEYFSEVVYEDGTPLYPDVEAVRQAAGLSEEFVSEGETEEDMTSYTLHIQTELEKPVEGVITQWFDEDGMMQTAVTDTNGDAAITGVPGDYTVHILVLPAKFAPVTENLMIEKDETEHTLTVYYR